MKRQLTLLLTVLSISVAAQKFHLKAGIGANVAGNESSANHSVSSLALFIEPSLMIGSQSSISYSLEPGVKFEGKIVQTSLPPQRYGANYLLNQYFKYLHSLGSSYLGLGYLLHYQRPFDTQFDDEGGVLSTSRIDQFGHGLGIYAGIRLRKLSAEGSYHYLFGTFNNFTAIKIGYRIF